MGTQRGADRFDVEPSQIAAERAYPLTPGPTFLGPIFAVGVVTFVASWWLGPGSGPATGTEVAYRDAGGWFGIMAENVGTTTMRVLAALAAMVAVLATGYSARRLLHGDLAGLAAAAFMALQPATLVHGQFAVPQGFIVAAAAGVFACAVSAQRLLHWMLPVFIVGGALLDPRFLWLGVPAGAMMLVRGHIYVAPIHIGQAAMQALVVPASVVAVMSGGLALTGHSLAAACLGPHGLDPFIIRSVPTFSGGAAALPNLFVHGAGLVALIVYGAAALWFWASKVRIGRDPGRLQVRLPDGAPPHLGRAAWLAVWMMAALLVPAVVPVLLVLALCLAMHAVGREAPGFRLGLYVIGVLIAALVLWRMWMFVTGADPSPHVDIFPWTQASPCVNIG